MFHFLLFSQLVLPFVYAMDGVWVEFKERRDRVCYVTWRSVYEYTRFGSICNSTLLFDNFFPRPAFFSNSESLLQENTYAFATFDGTSLMIPVIFTVADM